MIDLTATGPAGLLGAHLVASHVRSLRVPLVRRRPARSRRHDAIPTGKQKATDVPVGDVGANKTLSYLFIGVYVAGD